MTIDMLPAADYRTALEGAALAEEAEAGRIWMRGRDRAALLHRLSTNNIERLKPGQGARTVLTTPIGRIIDLLTVHALDDALLLLTSPGQGPLVYGHLRKNIFFNDQVTLEPAGRTHGLLALYGPAAARLLADLGAALPVDLPPHHGADATLAGVGLRAIRRLPIGGDGFTLLVPAEGLEAVRTALLGAGAATLGGAALELLRIEQGYGAFGRELSQEYIPLETGLADAISFTKGCYVGQEIIARMESRGRLAKQLRGLRLSAPLDAPARLLADGKEAGDLTSATVSPRFGPIALAYVRSAHAEPGGTVGIEGSDVTGTVVALPFD
ncbi:MAG TPA: glycine cleavage T C-terminal barrel domain-containing protein [Roseiflexaceae bacterium]|nr:glycine cleavage T C-terminal barrel domain-containing protein [Roseiflexaceae bacterium]